MSKLDELISELCPDGVEYVPLWSVTIWDKKFNAVDKIKQPQIYNYPYLLAADLFALQQDGGNVFLLSTGEQTGWTTEEIAGSNIREGEVVTIPWGKSRPVTDCIKYYKGKFVTADNRIMTSNNTERLNNKYLYYWIMSQGKIIDAFYRGSGIKHPDMAKVLDMSIPVPPLPVQHEIVRMLDSFTELTAELTAELTDELTARKKQYYYYSKELLSFDDSVHFYEIGDICSLSAGGDVPKDAFSETKSDDYPIPIISNGIGEKGFYGYTNQSRIKEICVTIAARGAGVGHVTYRDYPFFPIIRLISAIPKECVEPKFLYYAMKRIKFEPTQGGIPQLTVPMISKYMIPVPNLNVQREIVEKLSSLEKLCTDITICISDEIAARQKQYEHYRNELLSFKRTEVML